MNTSNLFVALGAFGLVSASYAGTDPAVGQHVPPFTAQVMDVSAEAPKVTPFDSATAKGVTVYMILGINCPASRAYADRISQLTKLYGPKGVEFIFVYSNREDTLDGKVAFHREHQLGGKLIDDNGGAVAKKLGARRTSELYLTDENGTIVYHGAVDDSRDASNVKQRYLQAALDETLAKAPVTISTSPVSA